MIDLAVKVNAASLKMPDGHISNRSLPLEVVFE